MENNFKGDSVKELVAKHKTKAIEKEQKDQ